MSRASVMMLGIYLGRIGPLDSAQLTAGTLWPQPGSSDPAVNNLAHIPEPEDVAEGATC